MEENLHQKVTIVDIAAKVGCSVATASRVLSGSNYPVSEEKRARIREAAQVMGYSPNPLGQMLKTNTNPSIGIIIPSFQNPFYTQIIMGIEQEASRKGYAPLVLTSQRTADVERQRIQSLIQKRIGCLMLTSVDDSPKMLKKFLTAGGKACVFEANFPDQENVINAKADMFEAGNIAMSYLLEMGHRNIAFFTAPLCKQSRKLTLDGCRFAMSRYGLSFQDDDIIAASYEREIDDGLYEFELGVSLVHIMLEQKRKYTAIIALNDLLACGVISELKQSGLRVPEDISVIGFDDIPYSAMMSPRLTTIHLSSYLLGQRAAQLMINALEANEVSDRITLSVKPQLITRESVSRPSAIP